MKFLTTTALLAALAAANPVAIAEAVPEAVAEAEAAPDAEAVAIAEALAQAIGEADAAADPTFWKYHRPSYPRIACADDLANVFEKLCGCVRKNPQIINKCGRLPFFGLQINAFVEILANVGVSVEF